MRQQLNARYDGLMTYATRSRDELLEEVSAKEDVTRPLSLRELADKVDRLMNEMTKTNNNVTANTKNITANMTTMKKIEDDLKKKTTSLEGKMGKCSGYLTAK